MKRAIASSKRVLPRLPIIPGFNDSREDAEGFVIRLREAGADKIQLLPFHQFGEKNTMSWGNSTSIQMFQPCMRRTCQISGRSFWTMG